MRVIDDGAGNIAWSVDGSAAGTTTVAAKASGQIGFHQNGFLPNYGTFLTNFSAVSTPVSTPTNVSLLASAQVWVLSVSELSLVRSRTPPPIGLKMVPAKAGENFLRNWLR